MKNRGTLFVALAVVLLMSGSLAADPITIKRGVDTFTTTDDGKTFYDFARNPIPAGFFCDKSAAFTGRIFFKGLPLATSAPGQLGGRDTVIERLDDAVFNAKGTAVTRMQFKALSLVSSAPVRTACGAYHAYVSLAGKQRVTYMSIHRTQDGGGTFVAPLAVDVRLTFVPVKPPQGKAPRKLELTKSFTFPATAIPWSLKGGEGARQVGSALVDTDGDLASDTLVRGTPNFWPGWSPDGIKQQVGAYCVLCQPASCHGEGEEQHCSGEVWACGEAICP